jgi:hypothetical protein
MGPLRYEIQNLLPTPAPRNAVPAKADSDAFSQILDRHMNSRNDAPDAAAQSRQGARWSDDLPKDREATETKARARQTTSRSRGHKSQSTEAADHSVKKTTAKRGGEKKAADSGNPVDHSQKSTPKSPPKTESKTGQDDTAQPSDGKAAAQPATTDGDTGKAAPDADGQGSPDGNSNGQQQSGNSGNASPSPELQTADDAKPDGSTALAGTPGSIPPTPQGIAILALTGVATPNGKSTAAQTQIGASAAGQNPILQPLAALSQTALGAMDGLAGDLAGNADGAQIAAGLKFGAVIANGRNKGQDPASALSNALAGGDSDGVATGSNPANTVTPAVTTGKTLPDSDPDRGDTAKSDSSTDPSSANLPVNPGQTGKTPVFGLPFPGNRPNAAVQTAALENDISARIAVTGGDGAADDAELSAFSQYLGPNVADSLARAGALRQSRFMTQLKQSLQALPPHEQIAVQIQNAMQNGSSRMTVDLQPAELGRVEIKLDVDKDKNVSATIVADRPATLDLLQRDAKALERALQQAGLQADSGSLSFSLRDPGGQGGGQGQGGNGGPGRKGTDASIGATAAAIQPLKTDVVAIANGYVDLET